MDEKLERVWLACDVYSLWAACREVHGSRSRINFEVLKNIVPTLRGGIDKVEMTASAYIVTHKRNTHKSFCDVLSGMEYMVKTMEVAYVDVGEAFTREHTLPVAIHDDWTAGIAVDAVHWLDSYDTFVLAAGCLQLEKLITYLTHQGKNVTVLTFDSPEAKGLYEEYADEVLYLTKEIVY